MIPLTTRSNGAFAKQLERRIADWSGKGAVSVKLRASEEMAKEPWWYWQEWGTAGGYEIQPKSGTHIAFPGESGPVIRPHVGPPYTGYHPGIKPARYIRLVLDDIRKAVQAHLSTTAFSSAAAMTAALCSAMRDAKALIVKSLETRVPGKRSAPAGFPNQAGKLGGLTAAEVFERDVTIDPPV